MGHLKNKVIERFLLETFTTEIIKEIVITLLGELVKRTPNNLDDEIYEFIVKYRKGNSDVHYLN